MSSSLLNPSYFFKTIYMKIPKNSKIAFISTIILSFIVHMYYFTNHLLNHDSVAYLYLNGDTISGGRWFFKPIGRISSFFDLPFVIGVLCTLYLALTVALTIYIMEIKKPVNIIIASGFFVSFPVIASAYAYRFSADAFVFGFLLATIAVYFTKQFRRGFLIGGIFLAFSSGIYQANIAYAISLSLLMVINLILSNKKQTKEIVVYGFKFITMIVLGIVIYMGIVRISLLISGQSMITYANMDQMGVIHLSDIPRQAFNAYIKVYGFFFNSKFFPTGILLRIANAIVGILIAFYVTNIVFLKKIYFKKPTLLVLFLTLVMVPLCVSSITLLVPLGSYIYILMLYSYVHIYLLLLKTHEVYSDEITKRLSLTSKKTKSVLKKNIIVGISIWLCIITSLGIILKYYQFSNIAYLDLHVKYERSYAFANRVVSNIESQPKYNPDMKVLFLGTMNNKNYPDPTPVLDAAIKGHNGLFGAGDLLYYNNASTWKFINDWIGVQYKSPTYEESEVIAKSREFKEMPNYPEQGSIKIIDGILVIKFSPVKKYI